MKMSAFFISALILWACHSCISIHVVDMLSFLTLKNYPIQSNVVTLIFQITQRYKNIIIIASTAMYGPWPSSDFATNHFSVLGCQTYAYPRQSWRIDVFLPGFSPAADRSPF
jgi:hypothetical protein